MKRSLMASVPTITEDTVTDWLREKLASKSLRISASQIRFDKPSGGFVKPDIYMENGAAYVVQAKLGDGTKTLEAVGQVWDCIRYGGVDGGFVVTYPEQLRFMPPDQAQRMAGKIVSEVHGYFGGRDQRTSPLSHKAGLDDIASWIAAQVLLPPKPLAPDLSTAIKQLRKAADYITGTLSHLTEKDLTAIYGGRSYFENVLQYEEGRYPLEEMQQGAAHLLINQLMFYRILSLENPFKYPEIDEDTLNSPRDILPFFDRVLEHDYTATFGFEVASHISQNGLRQLQIAIKTINLLTLQKIRHDLLGQVFHDFIPYQTRKSVAAFYTNIEAAELLAQLAIDEPDATVTDLAAGSGGLLVAAYRRKKELSTNFDLGDHKRFIERELTGIDIMSFAAHMAVINLSLQAPLYETEKVRVAVWDSTILHPDQIIPPIQRVLKEAYRKPKLDDFMEGKSPEVTGEAFLESGVLTLDRVGGAQIDLQQSKVIIMNPPFTRQERIPEAYKDRLWREFPEYRLYTHRQLGLYGYFILLADRFLEKGGRIALVMPVTLLRLKSCQGLRDLLVNNYDIHFIITTTHRSAFSEGARFREMLLVASKTKNVSERSNIAGDSRVAIVNLKHLPKDASESKNLAVKIRAMCSQVEAYEDDEMLLKVVKQKELESSISNLFGILPSAISRLDDLWSEFLQRCEGKLLHLEDYLHRVKASTIRGIQVWKGDAIFAPHMFILHDPKTALKSYDLWSIEGRYEGYVNAKNRATQQSVRVPERVLVKGLRRLSGIPTIDIGEGLDLLITDRFEGIGNFIEETEALRRIGAWKKYAVERRCHLCIAGRYDISASGTRLLAFFSDEDFAPTQMLWCLRGLSLEDAKIISLWMNSTIGLLQIMKERKETRGAFIQLLAYALRRLQILNPAALTQTERKILLDTFERVRRVKFPSILEQLTIGFQGRREIDIAVFKVLGFTEGEALSMMERLYSNLGREIALLKQILREGQSPPP